MQGSHHHSPDSIVGGGLMSAVSLSTNEVPCFPTLLERPSTYLVPFHWRNYDRIGHLCGP
jgi:hypothetical protein